jgi:thiamine biosynthesis lipoprotein
MKKTEIIMGMPITIAIKDEGASKYLRELFDYFREIDNRYSTYKEDSEISKINRGLPKSEWSKEMKTVLSLCEQTRKDTLGYFNIMLGGKRDPSGLVKGWSIEKAASKLRRKKVKNFYIEAGGDIQVSGQSHGGKPWIVGIRNPFNINEIIKTITVNSEGIATSGTYIRGQHIYNPFMPEDKIKEVKSITVIGPSIYDADRFATAAFAMGVEGIAFIESQPELEAYMVTTDKMATYTSGFERYVINA